MWGCSFSGNMPVLGYFLSHGLLSLLFWGGIIALAVILVSNLFRKGPSVSNNDPIDTMEILRARFARGEIEKDEFLRMKQILTQP